jgi:hypothetical protein
MFACHWPCLPLPNRGPQDASEAAGPSTSVETTSPVREPPEGPCGAARQSACTECGVALPAKVGPGRRPTRCDECRGQKRNGQAGAPLPDLKPEQRPMWSQDYEKDWLAEQLTRRNCPGRCAKGASPAVMHGEHGQGVAEQADGVAIGLAVGAPGRGRQIANTDVQGYRAQRPQGLACLLEPFPCLDRGRDVGCRRGVFPRRSWHVRLVPADQPADH